MPYKLLPPGKRGPYWYLRGTFAGRRVEVSTGTKNSKSAKVWAEDYIAQILRSPVPDPGGPVSFRIAADAFIAWKNPPRQDRGYIDRLSAWFGDRECGTITHAHLIEACDALLPGRAGATKNRQIIGRAAAVLHYAHDQGWCGYRRFKLFKESKRSSRRPARDETMALLIANAEGQQRTLLGVLFETGLRISDTLRIRYRDLDLPANQLRVKIHKTDDVAILTLSPPLVAMLASDGAARKSDDDFLFPWRSRWRVYDWLKPLRERLGVHYTPHLSRHALASWARRQRLPDDEAAKLGAWSDERSLRRYQHVEPEPLTDRSVADLLKRGTK
jgi:integrase